MNGYRIGNIGMSLKTDKNDRLERTSSLRKTFPLHRAVNPAIYLIIRLLLAGGIFIPMTEG